MKGLDIMQAYGTRTSINVQSLKLLCMKQYGYLSDFISAFSFMG
jgi:hypothetical protein